MTKKPASAHSGFVPPTKVSGPIRPHAPAGIGYHPHRAIHGSNPKVETIETKKAPKASKRAK